MRLPIGSNFGHLSRVGDRLKAAIPSVRGEQKAIAFRAGVTPETLNKILTGKTQEPGFETVARIARAAGVNLDDLYDGEVIQAASLAEGLIATRDKKRLAEIAEWLTTRFGEVQPEIEHAQHRDSSTSIQPAPSPEVPRGSLYAPQTERNRNASTKRARKSNVRS